MQNSKNSLIASIITNLVGVMVCIGWLSDLPVLTSIVPDLPSMKFNTALSFILLGSTTYLLTIDKYPRLQVVFITLILGYCTISLIQDIAAIELHIDEFFVKDPHEPAGSRPGRMAQSTEVCLVMISIVLLYMRKSNFQVAHKVIIHLAALISFIAIVGYLLNVPFLYNFSLFTSMSMPSALLIFMNSINISFLNPDIGMMKYFSSDRIGNKTIFRLFPRLVIAVLGLSVAELALHKKGFVTDEVGSALFTLSFIVVGFLLIYNKAVTLNRIDQKRSQAEDALKKVNENLEVIISERTKTLAEREQLLKSIFDNTDGLILVKGLDGVYTMGNRAFLNTFNENLETLNKKTVYEIFDAELAAKLAKADQEVAETGNSITYEVKTSSALGEFYFRTNKFPIYDGKNNIISIGTVSTDITDLKKEKADQEVLATFLQEQNKQLVNFSHMLTHNLRSPVVNLKTIIKFYNEAHEPVKKAAHIERMSSLIENLSITFDEMMEIFKIRQDISKERQLLSFEDVFVRTKKILAAQIEESNITITNSFAAVSTILYPKVYLESIFLNLMTNGIKYRSEQRPAHLHFETRLENKKVILEVKDNGIGIDMSKYGNILFGLNKTFHTNTDAKGVGLYITKTQVEAMGGSITAESTVDVGSTFKITFG